MSGEKLQFKIESLKFKEGQSGGWFSDPAIYITVTYNGEDHKTATQYGCGDHPTFEEEFTELEDLTLDDKLVVKAFSESTFTSDDFIGECTIFLDQVKVGSGHQKKKGFTMLNGTDSIGLVTLCSIWTGVEEFETPPEKVEAPVIAPQPMQQQFQQPQMMPQQQMMQPPMMQPQMMQ